MCACVWVHLCSMYVCVYVYVRMCMYVYVYSCVGVRARSQSVLNKTSRRDVQRVLRTIIFYSRSADMFVLREVVRYPRGYPRPVSIRFVSSRLVYGTVVFLVVGTRTMGSIYNVWSLFSIRQTNYYYQHSCLGFGGKEPKTIDGHHCSAYSAKTIVFWYYMHTLRHIIIRYLLLVIVTHDVSCTYSVHCVYLSISNNKF